MKTVTGRIVSSTPISISKVAKIISNFVATDNGASQALSAYLRRTSTSFHDLKKLHKELQKPSKSDRKHKKSKSETTVEGVGKSNLEPNVFNFPRGAADLSQEASQGYGDGETNNFKNKNKKKQEKENGEVINFGDDGGKIVIQDVDSKRNNEKKEANFGEDEGKIAIERDDIVKHKKERSSRKIEKLQGNPEEREGEKKKKKRKSREIEEAIENNSSSEPRKKKVRTEVHK